MAYIKLVSGGSVEVFQHPADYDLNTNGQTDDDGEPFTPDWYWWGCSPGCLPDGEAMGPFDTEALAEADARDGDEDDAPEPIGPLAPWFERKSRGEGEDATVFYCLKDDAPEWLRDAVQEAHDGMFPNDWVYDLCDTVANAIDDESLTGDDDLHEFADSNVTVYTAKRFAWAAEFCLSNIFSEAEERAMEMSATSSDMNERLGVIQYCAIERIAGIILHAWEEAKGES